MPDNLIAKERYPWVDWSKVICIVLMILCHTGMQGNDYRGPIAQLIYSFHMPAFFIISGFLYKPHSWAKTLKSFMLPIILFSLIKFIELASINYIQFGNIQINKIVDINTYWCTSTGHPSLFTGQWFLFALIGCRFIMGDIKIFATLGKFHWAVGLICFAYVLIDYHLDKVYFFKTTYLYDSTVALVFFSFGIWLKNKKLDFSKFSIGETIFVTIIAILMSIINGRIDMSHSDFGTSVVLFYANAIVASLSLFMWTSKLQQKECVRLYSTGTLALLGSHMILYLVIGPCLRALNIREGGLISIISTTIIVLFNYPLITYCQKKASWILGK